MNPSDRRFDWPTRIRPYSPSGLSSCLEEERLTLDGVRLAATWVDVYALRLVEWTIARRQSLVLCPPEPFGPLAALTAAAAHVWSMARYYEATGRALGSDLRVAVVTENLRVRGVYRRLGVGTARLVDVVPAATRSRTGYISLLGTDNGRGCSTIFLSRPLDISQLAGLDLAVVELPIAGGERIEELDVPLVLIAHDPSDRLVAGLAEKLPVFAWDDEDLRRLPAIAVGHGTAVAENKLRLERVAAGVACTPIPIPAQRISENAALFWQDIGPLLRAGNRSLFATELAAAAFVLFYDLMHLALPTPLYEASTRPLRARIAELERSQRLTQGDLRDLYVPMVAAELADLAAAIGAESPKTSALLGVLRERVGRGEDVLLVARTAELARTYATYLAELPGLDAVRVTSIRGLGNEAPADTAVLVGLLPTYARYLYTTGLAAEILVLAYETDSQLESVPGGFTECAQVRSAVAYQREYAAWLAREAAKASCWERLSGEATGIDDDRPRPPRVEPGAVELGELPRPPDAPPGLWDGRFRGLATLEERVGRDAPPQLSPGGADGAGAIEVEALRVDFIDGRWVFLDSVGTVTKFGTGGFPEAGYAARNIVPGGGVDRLLAPGASPGAREVRDLRGPGGGAPRPRLRQADPDGEAVGGRADDRPRGSGGHPAPRRVHRRRRARRQLPDDQRRDRVASPRPPGPRAAPRRAGPALRSGDGRWPGRRRRDHRSADRADGVRLPRLDRGARGARRPRRRNGSVRRHRAPAAARRPAEPALNEAVGECAEQRRDRAEADRARRVVDRKRVLRPAWIALQPAEVA